MPKPLYWVHPELERNGGQLKSLCCNTVGAASCRDGIVAGSHSHKGTDGMAQRAIRRFQLEWSMLGFSGSTLFEVLEIFFAVDASRS